MRGPLKLMPEGCLYPCIPLYPDVTLGEYRPGIHGIQTLYPSCIPVCIPLYPGLYPSLYPLCNMYPCIPPISHVPLGMSGTCVHRWNQNETEITIALLNWLDEDFPKNVYPSLYPPRLAGLYPFVPSPQ